jgi:hypothetical protein
MLIASCPVGRADYFGVLANTAARVCALAAPGQILVECSDPKAQPLGSDGQQLLKEYGEAGSLATLYAGVFHVTNECILHLHWHCTAENKRSMRYMYVEIWWKDVWCYDMQV